MAYLDNHSDLSHLQSQRAASRHFERHGRSEGRLSNSSSIESRIASLEQTYDATLPEDFDWRWYSASSAELNALNSSYAAAEHYLRHGRAEGRLWFRFDPELYESLYFDKAGLSQSALIEHYRLIGRDRGLIATAKQLAKSEGCRSWRWIEKINVEEFDLLNQAWAGRTGNKRDAVRAILKDGISRLAPLSFAASFEAAYYREANSALAALSDDELYENWLFEGAEQDRPGSASSHLAGCGLALGDYPKGFDWRRYADAHRAPAASRWAILDLLLRDLLRQDAVVAPDVIPTHRDGEVDFLVALAAAMSPRNLTRANELYALAGRRSRLAPEHIEEWGHVLSRLEHWPQAASCFQHVIGMGAAQAVTVAAAADALLRCGEPRAALLALSSPSYHANGDVRIRDAVARAIELAFEQTWMTAEELYRDGSRQQADDLLTAVVADVGDWWQRLDPIGAAIPAAVGDRVVLLANVDLAQCTHYRVNQKKEIFERAGVKLQVFPQSDVVDFLDALPGAKAAIFYRLPASPMNIRAILYARALGVPTLYDIDDLIFDGAHYPEPVETYGGVIDHNFYCMLQMGVPLFRAAMALCDVALASTTELAGYMRPIVRSGRAYVLPNGLDSNNDLLFDLSIPQVRRNNDTILFYGSGTKAHNGDFLDLVGAPLTEMMRADPSIKLIIMGHIWLDERFDEVRGQITVLDWCQDISSYWSVLREADINLAVLIPAPTTHCKSEIKWLEAAALGLPSIVSSTHRYMEVLDHDVDCLMAGDADAWRDALRRLIGDRALRHRLVTAARRKALASYSLDANAKRLGAILGALGDTRAPAASAKKRVLLVNIFFPPQTVGGSTRVVMDNLDCFLESDVARRYEFAVITSDDGNPDPYRLRVDDYRGVPVFRISTPTVSRADWDYEDGRLREIFETIFDIHRPDLLHVHSIQRFTLAVLEESLARGIPYINTVHDGWWVSDYTFLTDLKGRPRPPEEDMPLDPPFGATPGEALERRRRLRLMLNASQRILVVSDAFTRLMRQAGYDRATSVPNGVPPMRAAGRTRHPAGKVRIAQISGFTHHKGFHYVQAAFKSGRFPNIELTLLEHQRFGGRIDRTLWGDTDVRIVGKTRLEDMHDFYAQQDVLIVPSIWPESFGLVSREASAAGLWVIASDRGAIGESIEHGVNGWVIGVETLQPLLAVLAEINGDPDRFTVSPPLSRHPLRTAADQATEVAAIYDEVLEGPRPRVDTPYFMRIETTRRKNALRQEMKEAHEKLDGIGDHPEATRCFTPTV